MKPEIKIATGTVQGYYFDNKGNLTFPDPMPPGWLPCDGRDITETPDLEKLVEVLRGCGVTGRIVLPLLPGTIIKK